MLAYMAMIYPDTKKEEQLWKKGFKYVVGIDEAGRGPLAGPVVVAGVVIGSSEDLVEGVKDSKKMSKKRREEVFESIKKKCKAYAIGIIDAKEIDRIGIKYAVRKGMKKVVNDIQEKLGEKVDYIISDGAVFPIDGYEMEIIDKGDNFHYSIAAASVLAKVTRDRMMEEYSKVYPVYGFERNSGYGTKEHLESMSEYGICDIHRKSFKPCNMY